MGDPIEKDLTPRAPAALAERWVERAILASRWPLVPFHFGLLVSVVILLAKFGQVTLATLTQPFTLSGKEMIVASLSLIEFALIANLLLMVILSGYEGFVSRLDEHRDAEERLDCRGKVGFGVLKVRLMASIAAIAGVYLLEKIIEPDQARVQHISWAAGAFVLFVLASVVLALMERLSERGSLITGPLAITAQRKCAPKAKTL